MYFIKVCLFIPANQQPIMYTILLVVLSLIIIIVIYICSINAQRCAIVLLGNLLAVIRGHSLEFNSSCHNEAVPTRRRKQNMYVLIIVCI